MYQFAVDEKYNHDAFVRFLQDFLPDSFEPMDHNPIFYNNFSRIDGISGNSCVLGRCQELDLEVYEMLYTTSTDPRVSLTNDVVNYMKFVSSFSNALVVFHSEQSQHWRLSLITTSYEFNNGEITRTYSNPRRLSFLLGRDCKKHTPTSMLFSKGVVESFDDLNARFAIEVVTNEFFNLYREKYANFVEYITGKRFVKTGNRFEEKVLHDPNEQYFSQFNKDDKAVRDFVKKLFGRLVFLQFLQKKGWLGVEENKGWGSGDRQFMLNLYSNCIKKDSFLESVLEPLFFLTLNDDRGEKAIAPDSICKAYGKRIRIPYLNGGLFEKDNLDSKTVVFPRTLFCDLLEFFNTYNFTIDETDPSEQEIGIDPEMLGKIFENLLEDNKDKGAFYTPKEIVQYMCKESLIAYLEEKVDVDVRTFVTSHTHSFTDAQKRAVLESLLDVKICDPAIGSGAFPMGMMNELLVCNQILAGETKTRLELKKHIVKNNLYGVDIEKGAVDIARLRFWLAIIVDEKTPIPLPNLDYKIMQGNSLLESYDGIDLSSLTKSDGGLFSDEEEITELTKAVNGYFVPQDHVAKNKIKTIIQEKLIALLKARGFSKDNDFYSELKQIDLHANTEFFLWHTWFRDVFNRPNNCNGFDIVIGNPPYIKEYENRHAFDGFRESSPYYMGKMDLWYGFACHGIDLLRDKGILCFIAQNNWTTSSGAKKMRNKVVSDAEIKQLVDFNTYMVFENASIQTMIMIFEKNKTTDNYSFDYRKLIFNDKSAMMNLLNKQISPDSVFLRPVFNKVKNKDRVFTFSGNEDLLEKIARNKAFLSENEATNGIHTHHDKITRKMNSKFPNLPIGKGVFVLSKEELEKLNLEKHELALVKPFFSSREIMRYFTNPQNQLWVIYTNSAFKRKEKMDSFPNLKKHLDSVSCVITSDNKPYGLHRPREEHFFKGEKIIVQRKCTGLPLFSYNDFDCYVSAMYYVIQTTRWNLKFLIGILNSSLVAFWLRCKGKMQGDNFQIDKEPLLSIPLPNPEEIDEKIEGAIIRLVDNIIEEKKICESIASSSIETLIDDWVFKLYNLTDDEIKLVKNECRRNLL